MASYTISVQRDAWTEQADAILKRLENVDSLIDQLADTVVLPILARHYDASGLKVRTGALKAAVSERGAQGNIYQKTATGMVVGVDYAIIPYAQYMIEGTRPHDIQNAFGRGASFGIGGRFEGKFHPGNGPHDIYTLSPADLDEVEQALTGLLRRGASGAV